MIQPFENHGITTSTGQAEGEICGIYNQDSLDLKDMQEKTILAMNHQAQIWKGAV